MNLTESQLELNETFKLLTFEYLSSIHKMAALNGERLLHSDETLFVKIIALLKYHPGEEAYEDYSKMLENSQDEGIKYDCFEKEFSMSLSESSVQKETHSDLESEISKSRKDSMEDETQRIKRELFSNQRFAEVTKYTGNEIEIFQYVESLEDECKKEEEEESPIQQLKYCVEMYDIPSYNEAVSTEVKKEHTEQNESEIGEDEEDSDEDDQDYEEEDTPEDFSSEFSQESEFTPAESIENSEDEQTENFKKSDRTNRPAPSSEKNKKKYRIYSEKFKKQVVQYATEMGYDFTMKYLQVPKKNISRWMRQKDEKISARGRKPGDPRMEKNLTDWINLNIQEGKYVTQTEIRRKAKEYSGSRDFKASKGWLEKYFRRNKTIGEALNSLLYLKKGAILLN